MDPQRIPALTQIRGSCICRLLVNQRGKKGGRRAERISLRIRRRFSATAVDIGFTATTPATTARVNMRADTTAGLVIVVVDTGTDAADIRVVAVTAGIERVPRTTICTWPARGRSASSRTQDRRSAMTAADQLTFMRGLRRPSKSPAIPIIRIPQVGSGTEMATD